MHINLHRKVLLYILAAIGSMTACVSPKKVKLKEVYQKLSDEISGANRLDTAFAPSLALTKKEKKKEEEKIRKIGARVFYGFKTKRAFSKSGNNKKREYELFYVLKKYQEPNPYVKDIYWFHRKKRKIFVGAIDPSDKKYARILHGPYLRRQGRQVLEEGIFYIGTKHGRWLKHDKANILIDKRHYYKGWPKESEITYYDLDQKQIKEVIPIQYGKKEGDYFLFSETGVILKTGTYKENRPVGVWTEYYPNKKPKRQIQYPRNWWEDDVKEYVLKEFSEKGKVIYDYKKDGPKQDSTLVIEK